MSRSEGQGIDLEGAANVLVLSPTMDDGEAEGCTRLMAPAAGADASVLSVTLTRTPDERLEVWRARADWNPKRVGFVDVGDPARSVAADGAGHTSVPGEPITVSTVGDPGDLTGLGIEISRYLEAWAGSETRIVCCFHSLTALLQYVDPDAAFRFLHVLTGRLEAVDAAAHFHLDPTASDDRTVNVLTGLFDAVLQRRDGAWTVRRR